MLGWLKIYIVHFYICCGKNTHTYINEFIMCNTVKQSSNQRRGQSLGGGRLGDKGIKIK